MPRTARKKHPGAIFHVMIRSISEICLFRDNKDKNKFLSLFKKYKEVYMFDIYAYCLMSTHAHFIIDCCGSDISKIMKSINQSYAIYYNSKYDRHGHVFQDRFKSKIVDDDRYLIALSAYIHSNPKDIKKYKDDVSKFPYSSLPVYLGYINDVHKILNTSIILQHFSTDIIRARKSYFDIMNQAISEKNLTPLIHQVAFPEKESEYRSERKFILRENDTAKIMAFISEYTGSNLNPFIKFNHKNNELKSLYIIAVRCLCNLSLKDICNLFGNVTLSNVWRLSEKGYDLITKNPKYKYLLQDLINQEKIV